MINHSATARARTNVDKARISLEKVSPASPIIDRVHNQDSFRGTVGPSINRPWGTPIDGDAAAGQQHREQREVDRESPGTPSGFMNGRKVWTWKEGCESSDPEAGHPQEGSTS